MWPALLLLIAEPHVINIQEREPLMLVLGTPTGQVAEIPKSELIRIATDLLKQHTDFFPQELDEVVIEECKGRLTCLALKSRLGDTPDQPRYLLLISDVPIPEADRLSITLLDLVEALRLHKEAPRKPGWQDEVEASISEQAIVAPPVKSEVRDAQEATTFLATALTRELAPKLEETGHWEPYGEIEIECAVDGAVIKLDGNGLGSTVAGTTKLIGARPGTRTIELEHAGFQPYQTTVEVARGSTARAEAELEIVPGTTAGVARQVVAWSGVAAAAAGVAVTIVGIAMHGDAETSCFAPCDTGQEFQSFGYDDSRAGSTDRINPGGVAVLPLGFALIGAGATWSLGTWLFGAEDDIPWIQLAAGVAIGGATYAISVLADHSTPEAQ